ncbi:MAG: PSD1 and planctomycete cytochrome C domain-containing protein [Armatimonadota bacterium]
MRFIYPLAVFALVALSAAVGLARTDGPDFSREVRPILAAHCFKCHGPDDQQRMGGLRLDTREGALKPAATGRRAVVPGKPEQSELIRRISLTEGGMMPPAHAKIPLSTQQKQTLRQWVAAGAPYAQHWAFVAPKPAPVPPVKDAKWPRNPIDNFVLARLEAAGLKPSPEADRYTLVRRVYLDLIGIPPTPEEADAFVNDRSPDAYEKLVDRLLASPHYGERWARRWLDLARYADTNGYEKDRARSIWPYRDWVINAINRDMPFNQFTVEQLAGDMLPDATLEQKIATGFHRNTMLNEEGGIDPLEFRYYAMVDRTATTGTTWLGLTIGCAQCHTHKYDPITHQEYFQLFAFLNNANEPEIEVPRPEIAARRAEIETKVREMETALPDRFPPAEGLTGRAHVERKLAEWQAAQAAKAVKWIPLRPESAKSEVPLLTVLDDASVLASGDQTKRDVYDLGFRTDLRGITAIRLEALPDERLPRRGPGRVYYEGPHGDFFLSEVTLTAGGLPVKISKASHSFAGGGSAGAAIDGDPQTGWSINGGQGKVHTAVFNLEAPLADPKELSLRLLFERYYAAGLGRFRVSVTTDARAAEAGLPPEVEAALLVPEGERTAEQREALLRQFVATAPELKEAREEIDRLRGQMPSHPTTLVMTERPANNPRATYMHKRGEFLQRLDAVQPAVPAVLHPLPANVPRNRLSFARWLVDPRNPLVGRVTMNRQWAALFGRGIVRTVEDFGLQGESPTHPELLDWLALEFIRKGWSMKQMHRLMVTSATYRQSSDVSPALLAKDPENKLLARGPRFRIEGELIRDTALTVSGLLSEKLGGPSVFPPQPASVTREGTYGALEWKVSEGEDRYRRGLYTFTKRTAPYAMFITFDGTSGEACVARREVSNTPLQALTLLNDTVFVEASQALGRDLAKREGSVEERARYLFRRCVVRPPDAEELAQIVAFYQAQKARLAKGELKAETIAGPGEGEAAERAAWTLTARALLNVDEVVTRN